MRRDKMITQIYTVQTPEEAVALVEAGVDHIGTTPTNFGLPGEISQETCKAIFKAIGNRAKRSMLTVADNPEEIYEIIEALQPDIIHVCGYKYSVDEAFCKKAKSLVKGIEIMQAVGVNGPNAIEQAKHFGGFCDYIILDTIDEEIGGIGAAGATHDWEISKKIVEVCPAKVILAGGLGPDNVADAIKVVRPFGVDSLTKTNRNLAGGSFVKDIEAIKAFVKTTKIAGDKENL